MCVCVHEGKAVPLQAWKLRFPDFMTSAQDGGKVVRMTPAGIEPATLRFVAQHLNHCATAIPIYIVCVYVCVYTHICIYKRT